MRGTDPVRREAIQLKCLDDVRYARTNLSVSHLARFMATVHWTTSFLAWVEYRRSAAHVSRPNNTTPRAISEYGHHALRSEGRMHVWRKGRDGPHLTLAEQRCYGQSAPSKPFTLSQLESNEH